MKGLYAFFFCCFVVCGQWSCQAQANHPQIPVPISDQTNKNELVGGGCDGCELMYIGMPDKLQYIDTSAGWREQGQKILITGIVYKLDGKTPAADVIIYYWQTDHQGYYSPEKGLDPKALRHGHIRGWVKTGTDGKYAIYTIRPTPYPNRDIPAHIHTSVKEPDIANEYYLDEFVFDDDMLLTGAKRKALEHRGGSGILRGLTSGDLLIAEHNIILGLHIPHYPVLSNSGKPSGLEIGEDSPSFTPYHAYGPDKGSRACPVCKYGQYMGILYFVGNHPEWDHIKKWLTFLEMQSMQRGKYLKAYFIYGNSYQYNASTRQKELESIGKELNIRHIALTYVPSMQDTGTEVSLNKINPEVENSVIMYNHRNIVDKYISLQPTTENFQMITNALDKNKSKFFYLPEPKNE